MKLEKPAKILMVFVQAAVLATTLIAAEGSASAQPDDPSSLDGAVGPEAVPGSSGEGVAAMPMELPLGESDLVGSVMYRRSGEFERFDTDHDIDPPQSARSASGASEASEASGSSGDREIIGSHYIIGNTFNVRVPTSYAGKPAGVFAFSFNHVVLQAGGGRFTADCDNQRVFMYRDSGAARWRCELDFGNRAARWAESLVYASQVSIAAAWSDEECEEDGAYGIKKGDDLLEADCKVLLAVKHYWLDMHPQNRDLLSGLRANHALRSWGSGDIEDWGGVEVGQHYASDNQFTNRCLGRDDECPRRVEIVSLPGDGEDGRIVGGVPVELGGRGGGCDVRVLCGLGALQFLDLSENRLDGGVPRELGNDVRAPCERDKRKLVLDVDALGSLGLQAAELFGGIVPVVGAVVVGVGRVGGWVLDLARLLGFNVELTLHSYLTGCPSDRKEVGAAFREVKKMSVGASESVLDKSVDSVIFGLELASDASENDKFVIRYFGRQWKFNAEGARAAGGIASAIGSILDVNDIADAFFENVPLEYFHMNRSQLVHLNLSGNRLSGVIPSEIGYLEKLRRLLLHSNALSGSLPAEVGRSGRALHDALSVLKLDNNWLTGEIPNFLSTNLQYLDLSYNLLSGGVPEALSLSHGLKHIDLSHNALALYPRSGISGPVPDDVVTLVDLEYLDLSHNKLDGELPSAIGELVQFDCVPSSDLITGFGLVSPLGTGLASSSCDERVISKNFRYFDVSHNMLYGEVPNNFKNIGGLLDLYLNNNCFHGKKPDLPGSIKNSDFSSNFFDSQTGGNPGCGPCFNGTHLPVNADGELKMDCMYLVGLRSSLNTSGSVRASNRGARVLNNWSSGKIDGWNGIYLKDEKLDESDNRVVGLDLSYMGIEGELPSVIGYLSGLETLDASDNRISGILPDWLIGLGELVSLDLSGNSLTRTIWDSPGDVLFSLTGLEELSLKNNDIAGAIPESISGLTKLKVLDVSKNSLTGSIPGNLDAINGLEELVLSNNMLSGEIPDSLGNLSSLTDLNLSHNMLSGQIPVGVGQRLISVVRLDLSDNKLTGPIPGSSDDRESIWYDTFGIYDTGFANLRNLKILNLSDNLLSGEIPGNIWKIADVGDGFGHGGSLKSLYLENNCLTIVDETVNEIRTAGIALLVSGNPSGVECPGRGGCSGGVLVEKPDEDAELVADCEALLELLEDWSGDALGDWGTEEISEWTGVKVFGGRVTELSLENQRVSGVIPAVIGDLGGLKVLDLSGNSLRGGLPGEVGSLSVLTDLDLSGNNLSGGLPSGLGRLGKLEVLNLSGNRLSGAIPSGLGRLGSLTDLDLSDNRLSGAIPAGLGRLGKLEVLDLSNNEISGAIPGGLGGLVRLERLVLADNKLSGGIPAQLGNLNALAAGGLDLRGNCLLRPVPERVRALGVGFVLVGRNLFLTPQDNLSCTPCTDGTFVLGTSLADAGLVSDCLLLVAARRKLHGDSSVPELSKAFSWGTLTNSNMSGWSGVGIRPEVLTKSDRVLSLDLSVAVPPGFIASSGAASSLYRRQKLTGGIPAELASLWALESLDLSNNRFEGAIPIELGSLSRLASLDLSRNRLSGGVPEDLGDLLGLASLDLSQNRLEGAIPEDLGQRVGGGKQLAKLFLNDNFLTGSIPGVLGNLPLESLHLHYNCIVGATPANLLVGAASENLKDFKREPNRGNCADRCSNGKYVASPGENKSLVNDCRVLLAARDSWAEWGSLSSQAHISNWGSDESAKIGDWGGVEVADSGGEMRVVGLALPGNGLSEGIPETLEDLSGLASLDLSHNEITDPNGGLGKLAVSVDLVELDLSANGIKGQIPTSIGGLSKLRRLVLADNELSGIIPSGPTPVPGATPLLDRLPALEHLDLSGNALKGLVPSSLSALKHLDLSDNEITGRLPGGLFEAEELSRLDLSDNQLAGALPEKLYEHSGLVYLDLSHNRFSGAVKGGFKSKTLVRLDLSDNRFTGSLPGLLLTGLPPIKIPTMPPDAVGAIERYLVLEDGNSRDFIRSPVYLDLSGNERSASLAELREAGYTVIEIPNMPPSAPGRSAKYLVLGDTAVSGGKSGRYFSSLVYLDLSGNQFTGPVPLGYGNFADERPMERLDLSRNQITGDLPEWINFLQFSDSDDYERTPDSLTNPEPDTFLVSLEHNQMCTPQGYALGNLRRNNGKTAPVDIKLGNNECSEDDHASIYVPGSVLNSTYELPSASPKDIQVAWQHPAGQTGLRYIVEPLLKDTAPESQPEGEDCQVATSNTTATITNSESCEGFDAQHYTAKVTPVFAPAGSENRYYGDTARAEEKKVYLNGWQFRTVQQSTTTQAIHDSLGLENDEKIFWMDGVNQVWLSYSKTSSSKRNRTLPAGTTIAIQKFPANADLNAAKLGSADSDTSVLLHHGWNVVPAGGSTTRPAGNNGAWFIDSSFISCGYGFFFGLSGVRAILRYDIENESYDIELPCDQAEETRIISNTQNVRVVCLNAPCSIAAGTRYTARSGIDEINEYDPLYILFYSYLPVSARWENGKYVPG